MAPEPVYGSQAAQLLAGKPLCNDCAAGDVDVELVSGRPVTNALVIDPGDVVHAGDAIAGTTACGRDANLWRWIVPTARKPAAGEVDQ